MSTSLAQTLKSIRNSGEPVKAIAITIEKEPLAILLSTVRRRDDAHSAGIHIHRLPHLLCDGGENGVLHQPLQRSERGFVKIIPGKF